MSTLAIVYGNYPLEFENEFPSCLVSHGSIAQSNEHSPCRRGFPGLGTGLAAQFSHPVTL